VTRRALYLETAGQPGALVVLTHDALRLPCGVLLPTTSAELPLTSLMSSTLVLSAEFFVGDGTVSWTGPVGPVVVRPVREWAPARPARGEVAASALAAVRTVLSCAGLSGADPAVDGRLLADLASAASGHDAYSAASLLVGNGPGLTPSGDDVLAGFLAGAAAFGLDVAALREAVADLAPVRTTALSAALLWHAVRGECIDEVAAVTEVLTGQGRPGPEQMGIFATSPEVPPMTTLTSRAVSRLLSVGHTSGAALASGLVIAAESALRAQPGRAA
jgi:hypothetical protein